MGTFQAIAPRHAPLAHRSWLGWVRHNLFSTKLNGTISALLLLALAWLISEFAVWGVLHAEFRPDSDACQAARGIGACWGVIAEKYRAIVFGRYPFEEQWRPLVASLALMGLLMASCMRVFWKPWLPVLWVWVLAIFFGLMGGRLFGVATGLRHVPTDQWGGLPLTLMLSSISIVLAFPLGILLALGRRSDMPAIKTLCVTFVEVVRGVPLISVLFMASFMFPLLMPSGATPDVLLRVLVGISLFAGAYAAEIIRGGLQAIPRGQHEAAASLGLGYWQTQRLVILPQALANVVPGIMNQFIAIFKDTSLVTIVSLYELSGALSLAISGDANWRPFKIEGYLFITLIYFMFCFAMSRYSLWIEGQLQKSKAR